MTVTDIYIKLRFGTIGSLSAFGYFEENRGSRNRERQGNYLLLSRLRQGLNQISKLVEDLAG